MIKLFRRQKIKLKQTTHDYTIRGWGHDYGITEIRYEGNEIETYGWGHGISKGDYILLQNGKDSTRYKVKEIRYCSDPTDMWFATLTFAPRTNES